MSTQVGAVHVRFGGEVGDLVRAAQRAQREARGVSSEYQRVSAQARNMAKVAVAAAGALGIAFGAVKLGGQIREASMLAERYKTAGIVMETVGRNAGYTTAQMREQEAQLRRSGIAMNESREVLAKVISANIDVARATDLARLAQNAAVIAQTNSSEAYSRLIDGIASGNLQILKTLGLNVSWERSYAALASQLGKNKNLLTEQEKVQARVNAVMEAGVGISGVYEAAMDTAGKQMGSLKRLSDDAKTKVGQIFSASTTAAVFGYSDALKVVHERLDALTDQDVTRIGRGVAGALREVAAAGGFVAAVIGGRVVAAYVAAGVAKTRNIMLARQQAQAELAAARSTQAGALAQLRMAQAMGTSSTAMRAQALAARNLGAANVAAATAATRASVAARTFGATMTFLGGPVGAAIALLGALGYAFFRAGERAREAGKKAREAVEDFKVQVAGMEEGAIAVQRTTAERDLARVRSDLAAARRALASVPQGGSLLQGTAQVGDARARNEALQKERELVAEERKHLGIIAASTAELQRRTAARVAEAAAQEAARLEAQRLADEAAKKGKSFADALRDHADTLLGIYDALRETNRDASGAGRALTGVFDTATAALARMGDALTEDRLKLEQLVATLRQADLFRARQLDAAAQGTSAVSLQIAGIGPAVQIITNALKGVAHGFKAVPTIAQEAARRTQIELDRFGESLRIEAQQVRQQFTDLWQTTRGLKQQLGAAALDVAQQFTPLGLASTVLAGFFEGLQPLLDALKEPLRIVGELLGKALRPVLELLWPVFRAVAIAATYLGEIFFRVTGGIATAAGGFVRALGQLINKITPFASPGNPLIRAGEAIQNFGRGMTEAANQLARGRDELRNMSFEDSLNRVTGALDRLTRSALNVPAGMKALESYLFNVSGAGRVATVPTAARPGGTIIQGATIQVTVPLPTTASERGVYRQWYAEARDAARASGMAGWEAFMALPEPV